LPRLRPLRLPSFLAGGGTGSCWGYRQQQPQTAKRRNHQNLSKNAQLHMMEQGAVSFQLLVVLIHTVIPNSSCQNPQQLTQVGMVRVGCWCGVSSVVPGVAPGWVVVMLVL
jgi:hypothetical protein